MISLGVLVVDVNTLKQCFRTTGLKMGKSKLNNFVNVVTFSYVTLIFPYRFDIFVYFPPKVLKHYSKFQLGNIDRTVFLDKALDGVCTQNFENVDFGSAGQTIF